MISTLRAGNSLVHRLPAGPKLLALIGAIALISLIGANLTGSVLALALVAALFALAFNREGLNLFAQQLWQFKWLLLVIIVPQLILGGQWQSVTANALRLTAAMLVATLFTFTTATAELITAIESAIKPLNRMGVKPETVSLTIAMTINAIPMVFKFLQQTKEAQQARGAKPTVTRMTVPLLVASLKYADDFAEALAARGVEV